MGGRAHASCPMPLYDVWIPATEQINPLLMPRSGDLVVLAEIEKIVGADRLPGEAAAGGDDRGDAAACRLHPSHPDAQQVLPAVSRLPRQVCRLDPTTLDELLQSRRHVQYIAH